MFLIIGGVALVAWIVVWWFSRPRWNKDDLGQMSEQWLAEYRASHPWNP
jgi:hypothetical protein